MVPAAPQPRVPPVRTGRGPHRGQVPKLRVPVRAGRLAVALHPLNRARDGMQLGLQPPPRSCWQGRRPCSAPSTGGLRRGRAVLDPTGRSARKLLSKPGRASKIPGISIHCAHQQPLCPGAQSHSDGADCQMTRLNIHTIPSRSKQADQTGGPAWRDVLFPLQFNNLEG